MTFSRRNLHNLAANVDISGLRRSFVVADIVAVSVTKAPKLAAPPTADRARVQERAGVKLASGNLNGCPTERDISDFFGGIVDADGIGISVAQLTEISKAPAANRARLQQRTGVSKPNDDLDRNSTQRHITHAGRDFVISDVEGIDSVAKLAAVIESPTADRASIQERAGMKGRGRELYNDSTDIDIAVELSGGFVIAQSELVAVTEAPAISGTPATNLPFGAERAGVLHTNGDGGDRSE
jgi:hypothetical protein